MKASVPLEKSEKSEKKKSRSAKSASAGKTARSATSAALKWANGLNLQQHLQSSSKISSQIRSKIEAKLRSSAHMVQTEVDKALLNLHHPAAARLIERLASSVREPLPLDAKEFPLGLGRSVLARAQRISHEIRESISDFSPQSSKAPSADGAAKTGSKAGATKKTGQDPVAETKEVGGETRL